MTTTITIPSVPLHRLSKPIGPDRLLYYNPQENHTMLSKGESQLDSSSDPLSEQVGGSHYKTMKIQPVEFILANNLDFCQGNIIKYTCRYKQKGGVEDLHKVIHYARLLIDQIEKESKDV